MEHIPLDVSDQQHRNLAQLADYLLSGALRAEFDMAVYADPAHLLPGKTGCGTVGCAIGHGPYAGIAKYPHEYWPDYARRAFIRNTLTSQIARDWLLGEDWTVVDNTPQGAGRRIKYTLKHGIPSNWRQQQEGLEPLCYQEEQ